MPSQKPSTKKTTSSLTTTQIAVIAIVVLAVIAIVVYLLIQNNNRESFQLTDGDVVVIVLLRSEEEGRYTVKYNGTSPASIKNLQVILAGQILHVDVSQTSLINESETVTLVKNNVPEGQQFIVNPGESFDVNVTYLGQTLGFNYIYGFRINYDEGSQNSTLDVTDEDKYIVNVE
jgi:hypothetical protein